MTEYRFYELTARGHIFGRAAIAECSDDNNAIEHARLLLDKRAIEIWQGARKVSSIVPARRVAWSPIQWSVVGFMNRKRAAENADVP
jgi:hypothetical protein